MLSPRSRAAAMALLLAACGGGDDDGQGTPPDVARTGDAPDVLPAIRSAELPFQYPPELYEQRVQANVVLRLFVDSLGRVLPESTLVAEKSGYPGLDSAAVSGARSLEFTPAMRAGAPIGTAVLLPVHFRHPAAGTAAAGTALGGALTDTAGGGRE